MLGAVVVVTSPPVAVPDILLGIEMPSSTVDRCHSLSSLTLPPAALASLPRSITLHIAGRTPLESVGEGLDLPYKYSFGIPQIY